MSLKLSKKELEQMIKVNKYRLDEQVKTYPDEYDIYNSTIENLIFQIECIDDGGIYRTEDIIEWLKGLLDDKEQFDWVLSNVGK